MGKVGLVLCFAVAGCAYNPQLEIPTTNTDQSYRKALAQYAIEIDDEHSFNDWEAVFPAELTDLLKRLREHNLDLNIARLRVERAQQMQRAAGADRWPSLSGSLSRRDNFDEQGKASASSSLNFNANYTVDVWGARAARMDQREIQLQAQRWQTRSQMISLQAQFVRTYVQTLALNELRRVAEKNHQASVKLLQLFQLTFEAGSASGIELRQQKNLVLNAQSKLLEVEQSIVVNQRALALMLGDTDLTAPRLTTEFADLTAPEIAAVQPATLLQHRPDIQIAQLVLREDQSLLHQARVSRWPDISLGASWGLNAVLSGASDWAGSLSQAVSLMLFDAGLAKTQLRVAELDADINRANYLYTVANAYRDALDQLQDYQTRVQQLHISKQKLANSQALYDLSKIRYEAGDSDFINLLLAQQTWFAANESIVAAKRDYFLSLINVYESMGSAPALAAMPSSD